MKRKRPSLPERLENEIRSIRQRAKVTEMATDVAGRLIRMARQKRFLAENLETSELEMGKVFSIKWVSHDKVLLGGKGGALAVANPFESVVKFSEGDREAFTTLKLPEPTLNTAPKNKNCGVHKIELNRERDLIAVAGVGRYSECIGLFNLSTLQPYCMSTQEHHDTAFGVQWLGNSKILSVGRDGKMVLWNVSTSNNTGYSLDVVHSLKNAHGFHPNRITMFQVRDCSTFCDISESGQKKVVTVAPNMPEKHIKIWSVGQSSFSEEYSPSLSRAQTANLPLTGLSPCVATHNSDEKRYCYAFCNTLFVSDLRARGGELRILTADSERPDSSIRSISMRDNLLTCSSGVGNLSFFDIRYPSRSLLPVLRADDAIFCHDWDDSHTSLVFGGGGFTVAKTTTFASLLT